MSAPADVPVAWQATGDGEYPYAARVGEQQWTVRVNDFPAEPLYTLIVDDAEVADLEDWPPAWTRPDGYPVPPGQ